MTQPRILYVDAYDSFANNIIALLQTTLDARVHCVKIDDSNLFELDSDSSLGFYLHAFDAVVVGPGPGNPTVAKDVGWINRLWSLPDPHLIPVLGVCLGFQSLCVAFGGQIQRLLEPRHGLVLRVDHNGKGVFEGLEPFNGTMYHSLHVSLGHKSAATDMFEPSEGCPCLEPLGWDLHDTKNGPVLMGAKHISKPFCGVQFHPESVVTGATIDQGTIKFQAVGASLIQNWWSEVQRWNVINPRTSSSGSLRELYHPPTMPSTASSPSYSLLSAPPLLSSVDTPNTPARSWISSCPSFIEENSRATRQQSFWDFLGLRGRKVDWKVHNLLQTTVQHICQGLDVHKGEAFLLESGLKPDGTPLREDTGRYSIIGLVNEDTVRLQYFIKSSKIVLHAKGHDISCDGTVSDFWDYLHRFQEQMRCWSGSDKIPFWGGLMGFISYEAGLTTICVTPDTRKDEPHERPDISFVLVLRSVVVDHSTNVFYTQSIKADDDQWVFETSTHLSRLANTVGYERLPTEATFEIRAPKACPIEMPDFQTYAKKVVTCDDVIRAGDSYELCLTNQVKIKVPLEEAEMYKGNWKLYKRLSNMNTAPFAAYINLKHGNEDLTLLSSSPERFLSWSREGRCQFRPIKGTIKKVPGMTQEDAEKILRPSLNSKDVAENLMITDLVRHDLYGVIGAGNVEVTQLFGVEEYKTVFQLVSVIEGQLPQFSEQSSQGIPKMPEMASSLHDQPPRNGPATPRSLDEFELPTEMYEGRQPRFRSGGPTGIDLLSSSLPPGSMTGAPKRRSCEILREIEDLVPRGIYSGVLGYLDVGGGGDFSVVIRTAWKWSGDVEYDNKEGICEVWRVGAGGAVTAQSTKEGETQEMLAKLSSVLPIFETVKYEPPPPFLAHICSPSLIVR